MKNTFTLSMLLVTSTILAQVEGGSPDEWLKLQSCLDENTQQIIKDAAILKASINGAEYHDVNDVILDIGKAYYDEFLALLNESITAVKIEKNIVLENGFNLGRSSHDLQLLFADILRDKYINHYKTDACTLNDETFYVDFRRLMEPSLHILQAKLIKQQDICPSGKNCIAYLDYQYLFVIAVLMFEPSLQEFAHNETVHKSYMLIKNQEVKQLDLSYLYQYLNKRSGSPHENQ